MIAITLSFTAGFGLAAFLGLAAVIYREMERERREIPCQRINLRRVK